MFRILARVSGGVTGTREAWLKKDGVPQEFDSREDAETVAARLNKSANGPYATASFSYTVREQEDEGGTITCARCGRVRLAKYEYCYCQG